MKCYPQRYMKKCSIPHMAAGISKRKGVWFFSCLCNFQLATEDLGEDGSHVSRLVVIPKAGIGDEIVRMILLGVIHYWFGTQVTS